MWHKAIWIGHPMRIELTRKGLLVLFANYCTTRGAYPNHSKNTEKGRDLRKFTVAQSLTATITIEKIQLLCYWLAYRTFSRRSWTGPWLHIYCCLDQCDDRHTETFMGTVSAIPILCTLQRITNEYVLVYRNIIGSGIQHTITRHTAYWSSS